MKTSVISQSAHHENPQNYLDVPNHKAGKVVWVILWAMLFESKKEMSINEMRARFKKSHLVEIGEDELKYILETFKAKGLLMKTECSDSEVSYLFADSFVQAFSRKQYYIPSLEKERSS